MKCSCASRSNGGKTWKLLWKCDAWQVDNRSSYLELIVKLCLFRSDDVRKSCIKTFTDFPSCSNLRWCSHEFSKLWTNISNYSETTWTHHPSGNSPASSSKAEPELTGYWCSFTFTRQMWKWCWSFHLQQESKAVSFSQCRTIPLKLYF